MKFKFTLQAVLDARHSKVEGLEIQLSQLIRERQKILSQLERLESLLKNLLIELQRQQQMDEMDLFVVIMLNENINYTENRIAETLEALSVIDEKIDAKRKELVIARQEEEVMEILKEKELQRLLEKIEIAEQSLVDDIYIARSFRLRKEDEEM